MFYFYNPQLLTSTLDADVTLQGLLARSLLEEFICPYDGIIFSTDAPPKDEFLTKVRPARYGLLQPREIPHYFNTLRYRYFNVLWTPLDSAAPNTIIRLNPAINKLSPEKLLEILKFIVGSYDGVYVSAFDEKVDIANLTAKEAAKRIYVGYKRKCPVNYDEKDETYYFGSRERQQVKVYDKAKEQQLSGVLTRIEKKVKYSKHLRPLASDFLINERDDIFQNEQLVDIDAVDGQSKIGLLIEETGYLMTGYQRLSKWEKLKLRQHRAFLHPRLDIKAQLRQELLNWLSCSPYLETKVFVDRASAEISRIISIQPFGKYPKRQRINALAPEWLQKDSSVKHFYRVRRKLSS